jgi:hypothetical protein
VQVVGVLHKLVPQQVAFCIQVKMAPLAHLLVETGGQELQALKVELLV